MLVFAPDLFHAKAALWQLASFPGSLLKNGGKREPGDTHSKSCDFWCLALVVPIRWQNETTCTRHSVHSAKNFQLKNELITQTTPQTLVKKQFSNVQKDTSPERLRSKVTVVGLQNWLAHHTSQLRVYMKKCITKLSRAGNNEVQNCE